MGAAFVCGNALTQLCIVPTCPNWLSANHLPSKLIIGEEAASAEPLRSSQSHFSGLVPLLLSVAATMLPSIAPLLPVRRCRRRIPPSFWISSRQGKLSARRSSRVCVATAAQAGHRAGLSVNTRSVVGLLLPPSLAQPRPPRRRMLHATSPSATRLAPSIAVAQTVASVLDVAVPKLASASTAATGVLAQPRPLPPSSRARLSCSINSALPALLRHWERLCRAQAVETVRSSKLPWLSAASA